jgi:parallel beta-helix repeat protein
MKKALNKSSLAVAAVLATFILHPASVCAQGSLMPPGAPGPTMKTLGQVEPRTPVDATNTPGIFNAQFTITKSGSYYLTGNITGVSTNVGIFIETNDVTLDLNGFEMTGASSNYGINVSSFGVQNTVIRNGTLRNWGTGVNASNGFCELEQVRVYGCQSGGIQLGDHCTLKNCAASGNGSTGITIGNSCAVGDCLVSSNGTGISGGSECIISGSQANDNLYDGIILKDNFNISLSAADGNGVNAGIVGGGADGFSLGNNGIVNHCTANANNCFFEYDSGIAVGSGCTVKDSVCNNNLGGGIYVVGNHCLITGNTASGNEASDIYVDGGWNRIDNNTAGDSGISIVGGWNRIDNNTAGGITSALLNVTNSITRNVSEYYGNTAGNNDYAPIQTPATATSPWANF